MFVEKKKNIHAFLPALWRMLIVHAMLMGFLVVFTAQAEAKVRLKDVVTFEGMRDNMLMGYGLVVGLRGSGDKIKNNKFTEESLVSFLERLGVNTRGQELKSKNVAAVTVTTSLPPFARHGSKIDVTVSALGDSKSLEGGVLLATPLYGADGEVYAVAQGALAVGGFNAGGEGAEVTKGVPTSGFISNGAIVEKETGFELNSMDVMDISLRNPDLFTANNAAYAINRYLGYEAAEMLDPSTVRLTKPSGYQRSMASLIAEIERLEIETDQAARIVIDEASGTIVMGENVTIDTVAVAQGNLVVSVVEEPQIAQPGAFAPDGAQTAEVPRTAIDVNEGNNAKMTVVERATNLKDLVEGLNALGVGPRDLITILQTIKASGAMQAEIETR
jgi:flagellar P-ring protein precursor FlgI